MYHVSCIEYIYVLVLAGRRALKHQLNKFSGQAENSFVIVGRVDSSVPRSSSAIDILPRLVILGSRYTTKVILSNRYTTSAGILGSTLLFFPRIAVRVPFAAST